MKTFCFRGRSVLFLTITCLLLSGGAAPQAMGYETAFVQSSHGAAPVVIRRIANLGHNVIVALWIDGRRVKPIVYGDTFEGLLPSGRHVISLLPTPNPKWPIPSRTMVYLRRGQINNFVIMSDHSGHLKIEMD